MLSINAEELAKGIDSEFKEMRRFPFFESSRFAIFECNGIQVQVLLTKDPDEKLDTVQDGLVSVNQ